MNKKEQITFRISEEDKRVLSENAKREGRSLSNYLWNIIREHLETRLESHRQDRGVL